MSKNGAIVGVILILLVIFGVYYWANSTPTIPEIPDNIKAILENSSDPAEPKAETETAAFITKSGAVLRGSVSPRGGQTSYWYEYGETRDLDRATPPQLIGSGFLTYPAPAAVSTLLPGKEYFYRLVAQNQNGTVSGEIKTFLTDADVPAREYVPPFAETQSAVNATETSVTLSGVVNPRGSETRYWFEYGETIELGNTTASAIAGSGNSAAEVSAIIRGLEVDRGYFYRLNAQNEFGTTNGSIFEAKTLPETLPE